MSLSRVARLALDCTLSHAGNLVGSLGVSFSRDVKAVVAERAHSFARSVSTPLDR